MKEHIESLKDIIRASGEGADDSSLTPALRFEAVDRDIAAIQALALCQIAEELKLHQPQVVTQAESPYVKSNPFPFSILDANPLGKPLSQILPETDEDDD